MNKNIILGKWEVIQLSITKGFRVNSPDGSFTGVSDERDEPALVATAMNACQTVNPSNPMAVAENIGFMQQTLGIILRNSKDPQTVAHCRKVLSAIEKKE